jgi:hypothetical protein
MKSVLKFPAQAPPFNFDAAFSKLKLAEFTQEVLSQIKNCSEEELLRVRLSSQQFGEIAWVIECACDAELLGREQAKRGRGNKDTLGVGVMAASAKRARQVGCTPRTIQRNAQIFRLVDSVRTSAVEAQDNGARARAILSTLHDKHFYVAALSAADPEEALSTFTANKLENPKFRVSDAYRLLEEGGTSRVAVEEKLTAASQSPERRLLIQHIRITIPKIKDEIIPSCPDADFAERMYSELIIELEDHLKFLVDADMGDLIKSAWDLGFHTEKTIGDHTGLPKIDVVRVLIALGEEGEFIVLPGLPKTWHRVGRPILGRTEI